MIKEVKEFINFFDIGDLKYYFLIAKKKHKKFTVTLNIDFLICLFYFT